VKRAATPEVAGLETSAATAVSYCDRSFAVWPFGRVVIATGFALLDGTPNAFVTPVAIGFISDCRRRHRGRASAGTGRDVLLCSTPAMAGIPPTVSVRPDELPRSAPRLAFGTRVCDEPTSINGRVYRLVRISDSRGLSTGIA